MPAPFLLALLLAAPDAGLERLRGQDLRLAAVAHRLVTANAALCDAQQPATGLLLHARDQYGDAAARDATFRFPAPVAVEAVVPGSPAEAAGVRAGDGLVAVAGEPLASSTATAVSSATRDAALAAIAARAPAAPLALTLLRDGARVDTVVQPQPACRIAVELLPGRRNAAFTDGRVLQLGDGLVARLDDGSVAAVVAHELAHVVLRHRARLDAAGTGGGLFRELGRSGRLLRRAEREADALSVALLHNASYDPALAAAFWRGPGRSVDPGLFRSRIYDSPRARAAALEAAAAAIPPAAPRPWTPPLVATREEALQ